MKNAARFLVPLFLTCSTASAAPILFVYQGQPLNTPGGPGCPPPGICAGVTAISGLFAIDLPFDTGGSADVTANVLGYAFVNSLVVTNAGAIVARTAP